MSDATTGVAQANARREHHAEALTAEGRRDQRLGRGQLLGQGVLRQEAEHVDAVVRDPQPRQQQPHRQRVGAGDPQAGAGSPPDLRPGAQQDLQPLPRLLAAGEDDAVLTAARLDALGDEHPVRDDLVLAREPALRRRPRLLGDRDPPVEPLLEEAPHGRRQPHPAEVAAGVVRPHHRAVEHRQRGDAGRRRHRLVQVEDVELLACEHALDPRNRPRAEDDVRQRAVRGHDHRPADRDHLRRRLPVPADARMQRARELPGWVVTHHQTHVVAELPQGGGLQLRMLYDRAPEGPREGDDDAHFHLRTSLRAAAQCIDASSRVFTTSR